MASKFTKCTKKGQITLPKEWRDQQETDSFVIEFNNKQLMVKPISLTRLKEEIIFDADRDNKGKGIPVETMIASLKKIRNGQN